MGQTHQSSTAGDGTAFTAVLGAGRGSMDGAAVIAQVRALLHDNDLHGALTAACRLHDQDRSAQELLRELTDTVVARIPSQPAGTSAPLHGLERQFADCLYDDTMFATVGQELTTASELPDTTGPVHWLQDGYDEGVPTHCGQRITAVRVATRLDWGRNPCPACMDAPSLPAELHPKLQYGTLLGAAAADTRAAVTRTVQASMQPSAFLSAADVLERGRAQYDELLPGALASNAVGFLPDYMDMDEQEHLNEPWPATVRLDASAWESIIREYATVRHGSPALGQDVFYTNLYDRALRVACDKHIGALKKSGPVYEATFYDGDPGNDGSQDSLLITYDWEEIEAVAVDRAGEDMLQIHCYDNWERRLVGTVEHEDGDRSLPLLWRAGLSGRINKTGRLLPKHAGVPLPEQTDAQRQLISRSVFDFVEDHSTVCPDSVSERHWRLELRRAAAAHGLRVKFYAGSTGTKFAFAP